MPQVPSLEKTIFLSSHTSKRALRPGGSGTGGAGAIYVPTELPISSPSLGCDPSCLGCFWRCPQSLCRARPIHSPWLWNFIGLSVFSSPGGRGADGKSSPAEEQGGAAQGSLSLSQCSETTPGKIKSAGPATAPRFCSATEPAFSGLLPSFFTFPVASLKIFSQRLHTLPSTISRDLQVFGEPFPQDLASAKAECGQGLGSRDKLLPHHQTQDFNDSAEPVAQQCWRDPKVIKILCHGSLELEPVSVVSNPHCWGRSSKDLFFKQL